MAEYIYDVERTIATAITIDGSVAAGDASRTLTLLDGSGLSTTQMYVRNMGITNMVTGTLSYIIYIDDVPVGVGSIDGITGFTVSNTLTANEMQYFTETDGVGTYGFCLMADQTLKIKITSTANPHNGAIVFILWEDIP